MDLNPENNKDTFRERDKKIEELELQLKILKEEKAALESIIRMTYLSIGCNSDVIETEDWGSLPSRVACLKSEAEAAISTMRRKKLFEKLKLVKPNQYHTILL